eukprot:6188838-Pleurochrysis_carterae.AAC.2
MVLCSIGRAFLLAQGFGFRLSPRHKKQERRVQTQLRAACTQLRLLFFTCDQQCRSVSVSFAGAHARAGGPRHVA